MVERLIFEDGLVLTTDGFDRVSVVTGGSDIVAVESSSCFSAERIDLDGLMLVPGFFDLQVNGGFGIDLMSEPQRVWELGEGLTQYGVCAFLPTLPTSTERQRHELLEALEDRPERFRGAEPLGVHFEGPMLNPDYRGVHDGSMILPAELAVIDGWSRAGGVALVTLAPELPGATEVIAALREVGVAVAAGHSGATAAQSKAGFEAGIVMTTHLFNAMSPFGHRSPNLTGATLASDDVVAGLIVDGIHLDPLTVKLAWRAKGQKGIALVTDSTAAMGQHQGDYRLGGISVASDGKSVRDQNGKLAGSVLTMPQAVRNLIEYTGCSLAEALGAASSTPHSVIAEDPTGFEIKPGCPADLVVLSQDLEVQMTICRGEVSFVAPEARGRLPQSFNVNKESA